jgi:hypothetical protein
LRIQLTIKPRNQLYYSPTTGEFDTVGTEAT